MAKDSNNKVSKDVKKNKKDKRGFGKDFKAELKKVIWPTPKQLLNNTVAVITIVLLVAVIVFILDLGFEALNTYGINKLKTMVNDTVVENVVENSTIDENQTTTNESNVSNQVESNNTAQ